MVEAVKSAKDRSRLIYLVGGLFSILNGLLISVEFYYAPLLPVILAILLLAFFALDKLVLFIVFLTPLSINLTDIGLGVGLTLPTDPLLFGVMLMFFLKLIVEKRFDKRVANHPVTLAIAVSLIWMTITTITSEMPLVSLKFLVSRLWYVVTFYFVTTQIFRDFKNIKRFVAIFIGSFSLVICYTIIHHSMFGFLEQPAHWVMSPFFNDHTSYGASLAMFYPLILGLLFSGNLSRMWKIVVFSILILFTVALVLSYTRAAWVSLVGALGVFIVMKLRIKFSVVFSLTLMLAFALFLSWDTILLKMEKNRQDSSAELAEHVQSISNISTDASNLERLNRWSSAWRMFKERPFVGWGPGTYMFQYAPFQLSTEKTIISTNAGDKGNAHSEYIGPLAESGVFGLLSFIIIVITVIYSAVTLYPRTQNKEHRLYLMCLFLGLITYLIHGFLNNFLDTDKASAPFWGFIAAIVALKVYHTQSLDVQQEKENDLLETGCQ